MLVGRFVFASHFLKQRIWEMGFTFTFYCMVFGIVVVLRFAFAVRQSRVLPYRWCSYSNRCIVLHCSVALSIFQDFCIFIYRYMWMENKVSDCIKWKLWMYIWRDCFEITSFFFSLSSNIYYIDDILWPIQSKCTMRFILLLPRRSMCVCVHQVFRWSVSDSLQLSKKHDDDGNKILRKNILELLCIYTLSLYYSPASRLLSFSLSLLQSKNVPITFIYFIDTIDCSFPTVAPMNRSLWFALLTKTLHTVFAQCVWIMDFMWRWNAMQWNARTQHSYCDQLERCKSILWVLLLFSIDFQARIMLCKSLWLLIFLLLLFIYLPIVW